MEKEKAADKQDKTIEIRKEALGMALGLGYKNQEAFEKAATFARFIQKGDFDAVTKVD